MSNKFSDMALFNEIAANADDITETMLQEFYERLDAHAAEMNALCAPINRDTSNGQAF